MADYFDTGILVKYYANEPDSARAIAQLASATGPIYLPPFLELELKNALRTKHGRGEITAQDLSAAESEISQDIQPYSLDPSTRVDYKGGPFASLWIHSILTVLLIKRPHCTTIELGMSLR